MVEPDSISDPVSGAQAPVMAGTAAEPLAATPATPMTTSPESVVVSHGVPEHSQSRTDRVREAAYRIYEARGARAGDAVRDWLDAETEVNRSDGQVAGSSAGDTDKSVTGAELGQPGREYGAYGMVVEPSGDGQTPSPQERKIRGVAPD